MSHIHLYISRGRKELQTPDSDVYIVLEQYVDTMALYVSPFVLRRFGLVAVVFLCDELSANVNAWVVKTLIYR